MMDERPRYRNGVLVYTAKDIYDDVSAGMDPDCLFVSLEKFEAERANNSAGTRRGRAGMSKWKQQDEIVCMPNTVCCATACDDEDARLIVTKHNADIAALEAERDELRRRLEKMKSRIYEGAESACYCGDGFGTCEYCEDALVLVAIAEGRTE